MWPTQLEKLRGTLGLWTMSLDALSPQSSAEAACEIEELGYAALWYPEAWGREALTNAGLLCPPRHHSSWRAASPTSGRRDAVAASNGAKTLSAAYDERFVLGLGVSHVPLVEGLRGHEYRRPLTPCVSSSSPWTRRRCWPTRARPAWLESGSARPKMLELSATLADGALPYLVTPEHTALARESLRDKFLAVEQAVVLVRVMRSTCGEPTNTLRSTPVSTTTKAAGDDSALTKMTSCVAAANDSARQWSCTATKTWCSLV